MWNLRNLHFFKIPTTAVFEGRGFEFQIEYFKCMRKTVYIYVYQCTLYGERNTVYIKLCSQEPSYFVFMCQLQSRKQICTNQISTNLIGSLQCWKPDLHSLNPNIYVSDLYRSLFESVTFCQVSNFNSTLV